MIEAYRMSLPQITPHHVCGSLSDRSDHTHGPGVWLAGIPTHIPELVWSIGQPPFSLVTCGRSAMMVVASTDLCQLHRAGDGRLSK